MNMIDPRRDRRSDQGFTLLELIAVIAVMAVLVGLAIPRFSGAGSGVGLKASGQDIAAGLRLARSEAISRNREVPFTLNVDERRFQIGDRRARALPRDVELVLYTAQSEVANRSVGRIRFFPDGTSTGGRIRVVAGNPEKGALEVRVDWATGKVVLSR